MMLMLRGSFRRKHITHWRDEVCRIVATRSRDAATSPYPLLDLSSDGNLNSLNLDSDSDGPVECNVASWYCCRLLFMISSFVSAAR